ncbi:MAG: hypothetical protein V2I24_16320, partial [Halieaceae bacterium]|nr:hypothetical protein [Halieaceae bacterium]
LEFTQRLGGLAGNTLSGALILPLFSLWLVRPEARSLVSIVRITLTAFALLALIQGFLLVNAVPLSELLYGHGAFTEADRAEMVRVMQVLAFAPFGVLIMRMTFVWHLTSDRRFRLAEVAGVVLIDVLLRWWIMDAFNGSAGLRAIAAAMVVSPLAQAAVLIGLSIRRCDFAGEGIGRQLLLPAVAAVSVAALVAGHQMGEGVASTLGIGAEAAAFTVSLFSGVLGLAGMLAAWKALGIPFRSRKG